MSDSNKITKDKEPPSNQDKNEFDFNDQNELDYEEDDLRQNCNNSSISRKCVEVIYIRTNYNYFLRISIYFDWTVR